MGKSEYRDRLSKESEDIKERIESEIGTLETVKESLIDDIEKDVKDALDIAKEIDLEDSASVEDGIQDVIYSLEELLDKLF